MYNTEEVMMTAMLSQCMNETIRLEGGKKHCLTDRGGKFRDMNSCKYLTSQSPSVLI